MVDYSLMAGRPDPFNMDETPEERQRRLQLEASQGKPVSVSPTETFNRMLQVESGNRQFTPTGQTITSPKGAMGVGQIMPTTAMDPGYGVTNIFDLAKQRGINVENRDLETAKILLRNEPLNREFAENYFNAMNKQFGTQGAVAAYNAGPGRVQQNLQKNQGQLNISQLPQETQQYTRQVLPQQPMPLAVPGPGVQVATGQGVQGTSETPTEPKQTIDFINQYQTAQDDPMALLKMRGDQNVPEFLRNRASNRAYELMNTEVQQRKAQEQAMQMATAASSGDGKAAIQMTNAISKPATNEFGKYLKAAFMTMLGLPGAREALADAGIGNRSEVVQDQNNNSFLITRNLLGVPVSGLSANGSNLTQEQLINVAGGVAAVQGVEQGAQIYMDPSGAVKGTFVLERRPGKTPVYREVGTGRNATALESANLRPTGVGGTLADQRARMIQEANIRLQGKAGEEAFAILRDYNSKLAAVGMPPVQPSEVGLAAPQIGGAPVTVGGAPAAAPAAAPSAPSAVMPGAPAAPSRAQAAQQQVQQGIVRPTGPQLEAQATALKQEAQEVGTDVGKARAGLGAAERNADYLITKIDELFVDPTTGKKNPGFEVSVGASIQPGFQLIPGTDKANWYAQFNEVKGRIFEQAIQAMKGTGAVSDKEGEAMTKALSRMSTSQSEAEFKRAAIDFQNIVRRNVDAIRQKAGVEPKYGTKPESELAKENQQAREWLAKNPNHPRAPEVRRALGM